MNKKIHFRELQKKSPEEILELFSVQEPPIDLVKITNGIDGVLVTKDAIGPDREAWLNETSGHICVTKENGKEKAEIWINPMEHAKRQRFTLAHELGHLILHIPEEIPDGEYCIEERSAYWTPKERQANAFAARLLMPAGLVKKLWHKAFKKAGGEISFEEKKFVKKADREAFIAFMAEFFDVSYSAMEFRLKNLGVLSKLDSLQAFK